MDAGLRDHLNKSTQPDTRLPVTVLSGFLGAGKTTLLNHVLIRGRTYRSRIVRKAPGEIAVRFV